MFPTPTLPDEPGCLCVLIHAGTFPALTGPCTLTYGGQTFQATVGTNDPSVWRCTVWVGGTVYVAELKSDVPTPPNLTELMMHLAEHHDLWKIKASSTP